MAGGAPARLTAGRDAPTPSDLRTFALSVGGVFVAIGALLYWRGRSVAGAVLVGVGGALVSGGLIAPAHLGPVYRAWMALALAVSRVTTPVFMGVVYFGVVTPIALVMRLFGRRVLARPRGAPTYWIDRPAEARRSDLRRQF
jgi:hypothetical protein